MAKIVVVGGFAESLINFRGDLLVAMVQAGHDVIACAPDASPDIIAALAQRGVAYQSLPLARTGLNPLLDLRTCWCLFRFFRAYKPDVVFSYTIKPVIYASFAAKMAHINSIFSMITGLGYGFAAPGWKGLGVKCVVSMLYTLALSVNKKVFFQNPDDAAFFVSRHLLAKANKAVLVNGSGIDTAKFNSCSLPESSRFLLIARLIKDKGIYDYVDAAAMLKKKYPFVRFDLVGWLDENPSCVHKADLDQWIASGVIHYWGKLADVRPAIASCSVYVLPSYYPEGTPRTILEAMAMGRAIITTDTPGCRETVVEGENGYRVPIKNSEKLAEVMERFILQPALATTMGARSRAIAVEKYDVHKVNKVLMTQMELL